MAVPKDLTNEINALNRATDDMYRKVQPDIQRLRAQANDLKSKADQQAAGNVIDPAQLALVNDAVAKVDALDPHTTTALPPGFQPQALSPEDQRAADERARAAAAGGAGGGAGGAGGGGPTPTT